MKYLTPELVARSRSEDEQVADDAESDWERACAAYNAYLKGLRKKLPKGIRTLLNRVYLHDARVLTLAVDEAPDFSIFLQLDNPPRKWVELKYTLADKPKVIRHPALAGDGPALQWWSYDEIDLVVEGPLPVFRHSILLTGGLELQLLFHKLSCRSMRPVRLPAATAPPDAATGELELIPA